MAGWRRCWESANDATTCCDDKSFSHLRPASSSLMSTLSFQILVTIPISEHFLQPSVRLCFLSQSLKLRWRKASLTGSQLSSMATTFSQEQWGNIYIELCLWHQCFGSVSIYWTFLQASVSSLVRETKGHTWQPGHAFSAWFPRAGVSRVSHSIPFVLQTCFEGLYGAKGTQQQLVLDQQTSPGVASKVGITNKLWTALPQDIGHLFT